MYKFPDSSRICFVGDSITHLNLALAYIAEAFKEYARERQIAIYNCGISGATIDTALAAFEYDTAQYSPTHIAVCLGMNDSMRDALRHKYDRKTKIHSEAYERYKVNLKKIREKAENTGAKLILCTPTPYAEFHKAASEPLKGGNKLISAYAEYVREFAEKHKFPLCDYNAYLNKRLETEHLYGDDRVHPLESGFKAMAECFLNFCGMEFKQLSLSDEVLNWHKITLKIRDKIAAEHFVLNDRYALDGDTKLTLMAEYAKKRIKGAEYETLLAEKYPENAAHFEENIRYVKNFIKKEYKYVK